MQKDFGALLRAQRLALGLSQSEVARRAGVGHHVVADWEYDRRVPSVPTLCQLLEALEVPGPEWAPWVRGARRASLAQASERRAKQRAT